MSIEAEFDPSRYLFQSAPAALMLSVISEYCALKLDPGSSKDTVYIGSASAHADEITRVPSVIRPHQCLRARECFVGILPFPPDALSIERKFARLPGF